MGLKDFFKNRRLKKAAKLQNGSALNGNGLDKELKAQVPICDDVLCVLGQNAKVARSFYTRVN